jgi:hypothetical protein
MPATVEAPSRKARKARPGKEISSRASLFNSYKWLFLSTQGGNAGPGSRLRLEPWQVLGLPVTIPCPSVLTCYCD